MKRQVFENTMASLEAIIAELNKTKQFYCDESRFEIGVDENDIKVLDDARIFLKNNLMLSDIVEVDEEEYQHTPISKEMDECVSDFMEAISEVIH